ncbi:hypothetical protein CDEST_10956 [Colletotrichum destructivum]|uniref:Uncharacterized protein n=1 Tax=Colletotrichum destructivum TaxID=34406 RepID=A0AAX4IRX6_9PEZI|nr:hypothetical protein CDEST_10956 [Colletotrichum destructivum]
MKEPTQGFDQYDRSLRFHNSTSSNTRLRIASLILMGMGTSIAVQTVFEGRDVAPATSLIALQSLVSAVVDSAVTVDSSKIVGAMRRIYPNLVDGIIGLYNMANTALRDMFLIATVLGCLIIFECAFIERKSVKRKEPKTETQS